MDFTAFDQAEPTAADTLRQAIRHAKTPTHDLIERADPRVAHELAVELMGKTNFHYTTAQHTPSLRDKLVIAAVRLHYPLFDPDFTSDAAPLLTYWLMSRAVNNQVAAAA